MIELFVNMAGGWPALMLMASAAATTMALFFVAATLTNRARHRQLRRVELVRSRFTPGMAMPAQIASLRKNEARSFADGFVQRYLPRPDALAVRLQRTGFKLTIGHYAIISVVVGCLVFAAGFWLFEWSLGLASLAGLGAALALPNQAVGILIGRRQRKFTDKLAEAIDIMVRGLKAGLPVTESINAVGNEAPEPVRSVFRRISDLVRVGDPLENAIEKAAKEMDTPELKFLAITLSIQKETGGNLGETLENLAEILRKRRHMKLKIRAVSSEARASAYIIGSLPFVMFGVLYLTSRSYVMELIYDPRGHVMIGVRLGLIMIGALVMFKMVRFDI